MQEKGTVATTYSKMCRLLAQYSIIKGRGIHPGDLAYYEGKLRRASKRIKSGKAIWAPTADQLIHLMRVLFPADVLDNGFTIKAKNIDGQLFYRLSLYFNRGKALFHGPSLKITLMMGFLYFLRSYWVDERQGNYQEKDPLKKPNGSVDLTTPH